MRHVLSTLLLMRVVQGMVGWLRDKGTAELAVMSTVSCLLSMHLLYGTSTIPPEWAGYISGRVVCDMVPQQGHNIGGFCQSVTQHSMRPLSTNCVTPVDGYYQLLRSHGAPSDTVC